MDIAVAIFSGVVIGIASIALAVAIEYYRR